MQGNKDGKIKVSGKKSVPSPTGNLKRNQEVQGLCQELFNKSFKQDILCPCVQFLT